MNLCNSEGKAKLRGDWIVIDGVSSHSHSSEEKMLFMQINNQSRRIEDGAQEYMDLLDRSPVS